MLTTMEVAPLDEWASTVVLSDGDTALIRPITPEDAPALAAFHEAQSPDSRYMRYFSPKPTLSSTELDHFTNVDFVDRAALVAEAHGEFVAWASFERWQHRDDADVAFMVADAEHGRGIATLLLEHLAAIAQSVGIKRFTAQTLGENRAMLGVFTKAGWPLQRRFESGVIDVDFALESTDDFVDSLERREQRADSRAVARLLLPTSIAVIGASDRVGSIGHTLWNHVTSNRQRPAYAVNPHHDEVDGCVSYKSVVDIPDEVGLAVVAVPTDALESTIDQCIEKRVRGAVVVTAVEGSDIDLASLVARSRRNGLRLIGPASMGIASPRPSIALQAAIVDVSPLPAGGVAISMQSGTLASSLLQLADRLQLGTSWFISLGDKSDVSANDLLQFWEDDESTNVIALYTESLGNPRKFGRIARRVSTTRPIVAVRTGAALVGSGTDALFGETGVIEVPTVTALLDTARVLATQPLMHGDRVAVITNSRSPGVFARATLAEAGLDAVAPPVGMTWRSTSGDYATAISSALDDDSISAVLVIHAPPHLHAIDEPIPVIEAAADGATKPLVTVMLGKGKGPLRPGSPIPAFSFPEQAAAALGRLRAYSRWREDVAASAHDELGEVAPAVAGMIIDRFGTQSTMPPSAIGELLACYGVTMPVTELVPADEALDAAARIGYPVAIKAASGRTGRSARGGVALDISDAHDASDAVEAMTSNLGSAASELLVQPMIEPGVDLRIRIEPDEIIGPVITVGLGGLRADAIGDEVSRLAPVSTTTARSMLATSRAASLLDEADTDAAADAVVRVAQLASDHPRIASIDLNPVVVSNGALSVVDAGITLHDARPDRALRRLE